MKLRVSVAGILFPEARKSFSGMERTLRYLRGKVDMVEFYYEGGDDASVGKLFKENELAGIFVAVIPLKEKGLNLCGLDEENRKAAIAETIACIDRARGLGAEAVMVCSGKNPANRADISRCLDAFVQSMQEISDYMKRTGESLRLLLEPCDSEMDARHLLGPTKLAVEAVRRVREFCPGFSLTMDTAHVLEEGEDFLQAMELARPYCSHVHFANCMVANRMDALYGDKHVGFDYPDGGFTYLELEKIFKALEKLYGDGHLDIALEILCRETDPFAHFEAVRSNTPWLFSARAL